MFLKIIIYAGAGVWSDYTSLNNYCHISRFPVFPLHCHSFIPVSLEYEAFCPSGNKIKKHVMNIETNDTSVDYNTPTVKCQSYFTEIGENSASEKS